MYNGKKFKMILVGLFILVVVVSAVIYYAFGQIQQKNRNYGMLFSELSFQSDKQNYLTSSHKILTDIDSNISRVEDSIISKDGEVAFIENLELIARGNGLSIEISSLSLNNNLKTASSSVDVLNIKAVTRGSWSGNYAFLARLEYLPVKIKVDKVSLTNVSSDIGAGAGKAKANVWQNVFEIDVLEYK